MYTPYFPVATETVKHPHPSFAPLPSYFRAQAKPTLQQYIDTFGETAVNDVFLMARAEEEEDTTWTTATVPAVQVPPETPMYVDLIA